MKAFAFAAGLVLLCIAPGRAEPVSVEMITVVDGDTVVIGPPRSAVRYRLVGFDTPEVRTPRRKVSPDERALGNLARERLIELLHSGTADLTEVRCSCPAETFGSKQCNNGRKCGILKVDGKDVGSTLIAEELAVPFVCGETKCPSMPKWQKIIEKQFPSGRSE
ncbi:thermonuclease family protein [Bradyrhizobium tunisiense]|uniref:thermonuclease family protein n=1 Tax=Bradyrhizobium tunisiense TaxID=3278709 RepID=UPI0035DCCC46